MITDGKGARQTIKDMALTKFIKRIFAKWLLSLYLMYSPVSAYKRTRRVTLYLRKYEIPCDELKPSNFPRLISEAKVNGNHKCVPYYSVPCSRFDWIKADIEGKLWALKAQGVREKIRQTVDLPKAAGKRSSLFFCRFCGDICKVD